LSSTLFKIFLEEILRGWKKITRKKKKRTTRTNVDTTGATKYE
jgi:hypothetical protein